MNLEKTKLLIETAEAGKIYTLPENIAYDSFILLEKGGKFTYQLHKKDGKLVEALRPNYGIRWFIDLKNIRRAMTNYFVENKFIFKV